MLDVSLFGAYPTNNPAMAAQTTAGLNAALAVAKANNIATIGLRQGVYYVNGALKTDRSCIIEGVGPQHSVIKAASDFQPNALGEKVIVHQHRDGIPVSSDTMGPTERLHLRNVYIDGNSVAGIEGIRASIQQPTAWQNVRVERCPGVGVRLVDSNHAVIQNLQIINCGVGLWLRGSSQISFYTTNVEQCATGIRLDDCTDGNGSGSFGCSFRDTHFESIQDRAFDIVRGAGALFDHGYMALGCPTATMWQFGSVNGAEPQAPLYEIRSFRLIDTAPGVHAIVDTDRGLDLHPFTHFRGFISCVIAGGHEPSMPAKAMWFLGRGGAYLNLGVPDGGASIRTDRAVESL